MKLPTHQKGMDGKNLKSFLLKSLSMLTLALFSYTAVASDTETEKYRGDILGRGTYAEPVKGKIVPPVYPRIALRTGTEGWVLVRYIIREDGTTDEVEVYDASYDRYFDKTAIKAVKKWVYKPATFEGKPVTQFNKTGRLLFYIEREEAGGITKPFHASYKKISGLLESGDLDQAKEELDKLDGKKRRILTEVCYLDMLKANYFAKLGDKTETLRYVERALVIADNVASKGVYINLLKQAVFDNAVELQFQNSLKHYETLLEVDTKLADDAPVHTIAERVKQALNDPGPIVITGEISECGYCAPPASIWTIDLNRNRFSIDQVNGVVDEIEVQCNYGSVSLAYDPELVWSINKDWGYCFLRVYGDVGTTLRLLEHANEG